jgi:hypothetical protein
MIWLGQEDDPERHACPKRGAAVDGAAPYEQRGTEMVRRKLSRDGSVELVRIANFVVRIIADIAYDEGQGEREFSLEGELGGQKTSFVVSAAEFGRMNWVLRELGPQAIIYPGQQQHVRAAIQFLSGAIRREHIFTHLGWVRRGNQWLYLHAGGALGTGNDQVEFDVRLPGPLQHYRMCLPAEDASASAVRASLSLLSVAPDRISVPLLGAVYRAPLGAVDFSLFLVGRTGTFKTSLAALCQQHFGAELDPHRLPANFASTANALEELAFCAKDSLLLVDDFAPTGGAGDGPLHAIAERLFRSSGNHRGRLRMEGQRVLSHARPPRGLILATGEEVPHGQSLRPRLVIVELLPGEVNRKALSDSQYAGGQGAFATAMAAYISWIACRFEQRQEFLRNRVAELRQQFHASLPSHARLPAALAELQAGWESWLQFAAEVGAINENQQQLLLHRAVNALSDVARTQSPYQYATDPALRFLGLLRVAFASGRAHLADRRGRVPEAPERWGWQRGQRQTWTAQGRRVGWITGGDVYLEPTVSYQLAQQIAGLEGLPVSPQTLRRRLHEQGLLASVEACRRMLLIRKTLEGTPRAVLHLRSTDLIDPIIKRSHGHG